MTHIAGETVERPMSATPNYPRGSRVPINIDPGVRERLRNLLYEPEMRGVGYSEFILRAVNACWEEILAGRQ